MSSEQQNTIMTITKDDIRREFLAAGFTIKPGQDDLKPYVYEAARRLLSLAAMYENSPLTRTALQLERMQLNGHTWLTITAIQQLLQRNSLPADKKCG